MGTITAHTTAADFTIETRTDETILETLRRANLPAAGFLLYDQQHHFVSLTHILGADEMVDAYSLRNPDFGILQPSVQLSRSPNPVAEVFAAATAQQTPALLQFTRTEGIDYIYSSFATVIDTYRASTLESQVVQVALSGGGDGRIVGECVGRYRQEHPDARFHAVITSNGFEDEQAHLESASRIATTFDIPFTVYDEQASAKLLGFRDGFASALDRYHSEFPHDEAEILATYWVQELNFEVASAAGRNGIIFGFNQEDVIAERLYQALHGHPLPNYPIRSTRGFDLIAPLYKIPKRLIDALDVGNSMRNYDRRQPSVSYLRSSVYFMAYLMIERFPALAAAFADPTIVARASDDAPAWLITPTD